MLFEYLHMKDLEIICVMTKKSPMFLFIVFRTCTNVFVTCFHKFQIYESSSIYNYLLFQKRHFAATYFKKTRSFSREKNRFRRFEIRENMLQTVNTLTVFWVIFGKICIPSPSLGKIKNWGHLFNFFFDMDIVWSEIIYYYNFIQI